MANKVLKNKYNDPTMAKTKFDMCNWMDTYHWRQIPWVHMMLDVMTKNEIKSEYVRFLNSTFNN